MTKVRVLVLAAVIGLAPSVAGCGSSGGDKAGDDTPSADDTAVPANGGLDDEARTQACITEKRTVETAAEAFNAMGGRYPTSNAELTDGAVGVDDQPVSAMLKRAPTYWKVSAAGTGELEPLEALPPGCA
jgi:hypothetical protein